MEYRLKTGEVIYEMQVKPDGGRLYQVSVLDRDHRIDVFKVSENLYSMIYDDCSYEVDISKTGDIYNVFVKGTSYSVQILRPEEGPYPTVEEEKKVRLPREEVVVSPMTFTVVNVLVNPGEVVDKEQVLLIAEAMKLEMPIPSPIKGRVKEVLVKEGQTVDTGTKLITLDPL